MSIFNTSRLGGGWIARAVTGATALASALGLMGGTALAASAPGTLTYQGCISEAGGDLCATHFAGLAGPWGLAASPDGANFYLPGGDGDLTVLNRSGNGAISFNSCQQASTTSGTECPASGAISAPRAVAISGDGKNVYVSDSGMLLTYTRGVGGALTFVSCIGDNNEQLTCATRVPGTSLTAGSGPGAILVSPDGRFVYTANTLGANNGAVDVFSRDSTGALTALGCIDAAGGSVGQGCSSQADGLVGAGSLVLTSTGYLLVGGYTGVASFKVAADGTLSTVACIGSQTGCVQDPNLLGSDLSAQAISLSPDGAELYVASNQSHALNELSVNGGQLAAVSCFSAAALTGCSQTLPAVSCPTAIASSSDGADVYVTDDCAEMLSTYARSSTGVLTFAGCVAENGSVPTCQAHASGLDGPIGLQISADDSQLIVSAHAGGSIATFARVLTPPTITITSPANGVTYTAGTTVNAAFSCTAVTGGAVSKSCIGSVADGQPVDTTTLGSHTFTVTVTDQAGTQTTQSVSYTVVAPKLALAGFKQSHSRWREQRTAGKHAPVAGTVFSFTLSRQATVTLAFTAKSGKGKHRRTVTLGHLRLNGRAGLNKVSFKGRLGKKRLKPGAYTVSALAVANAASATAPAALHFTILR